MKNPLYLIFVLYLLTIVPSCKKTDRIENSGIAGNWQLKSIFNGYANGGNFKWNEVAFENSPILSFTNEGLYFQKGISGNARECRGTYRLQPSDTLEINTDCNLVTLKILVSELTKEFLILDYQGREGKIRERYIAVE